MSAPTSALRTLWQPMHQHAMRSGGPLARQTLRQYGPTTMRRQFFQGQRRLQSTVAEGTDASGQSAFQKLMNSPVGPKTVHFWAPIMKWGVVIAGLSDLARPASALSLSQNAALVCTGTIWTRWCFVIRPQNMFLATVNFFLACTGATQCTRIFMYRRQHSDKPLMEDIKEAAEQQKDKIVQKTEEQKDKLVGKTTG